MAFTEQGVQFFEEDECCGFNRGVPQIFYKRKTIRTRMNSDENGLTIFFVSPSAKKDT